MPPPQRGLGLGCMRLSTSAERDEAQALALLHAAFDAGVDFLDTADAYGRDDSERGHNERLIARALASRPADRSRVRVATKGGLTRPGGRWVPDGRAGELAAACEASLRALGQERLFLYQLHAPDPRVPLATSVRALARLREQGRVERIGLCNVDLRQLEEALRITRIDAVQVELSVLHDASLWNGVAARCLADGLLLLAHRPLGGPAGRRRIERDPVLAEVAARHAATPSEVALAWLRDLSPLVLPIPGATRLASLASTLRASRMALDDQDRALLDARFPGRLALRGERRLSVPAPAATAATGEVVIVMGLPAAGKSTLAERLLGQGYERLNRDERGGRLVDLVPLLAERLASGRTRVVLDNTYPTRKSRAAVIEAAAARGVPVRCVLLKTSLEDAQLNAVERMLARHGRLLGPAEIAAAAKQHPGTFPPSVLFRYQRTLEPPDASEGFTRIDEVAFERRRDGSFANRALVVWLDGVVWRSRSGRRAPLAPADVEVLPGRGEALRRRASGGLRVLGLTWQPDAEGPGAASALGDAVRELRRQLGLEIDVAACTHPAGPPVCWCRKPLPGLGAALVRKHELDPGRCLYVGASSLDRSFAARLGFEYRDSAAFFSPDAGAPV